MIVRAVEIGWMVLMRLTTLALPAGAAAFGSSFFTAYERVSSTGWALFSIVGLALIAMVAQNLGPRPPAALAWWAVALAAADAVFSLVFTFEAFAAVDVFAPMTRALGHLPLTSVMLALPLAFDILFWILLVRLGRGCVSTQWTTVYGALRGVSLLLSLPSLLPYDTYRAVFLQNPVIGPVLSWSRLAFAAAHALTAVLALGLVARSAASSPADAQPAATPAKASPQRDMLVGGLWLAGGLIVTLVSYSSASGGGRYVITTGAIAYGLVRVVRGMMKMGDG